MLQHEPSAPGGHLLPWLAERGIEADVLHIYADGREVDMNAYDLIVPLGSEAHAYDDTVPWLARELQILQAAVAKQIPMFGICFGGQLLARALGGTVGVAPAAEIGWFEVQTSDPALVPVGPWFQWHYDSFSVPPGATAIAETAAGPQAFSLGRTIGLQFHPEVTAEIVGMWAEESPDQLERAGLDPAALLEQTRAREAQSRAAAWRLFDALLSSIAAGSDRR